MEGLFLLALAASEAVWGAGVVKFLAPPMVATFRTLFGAGRGRFGVVRAGRWIFG